MLLYFIRLVIGCQVNIYIKSIGGFNKMKFYSEALNKVFDSEKECLKAEREYTEKRAAEERRKKELADTRKMRAQELETALADISTAKQHYCELLKAFCEDYGSYHCSVSVNDDFPLIDRLFKFF